MGKKWAEIICCESCRHFRAEVKRDSFLGYVIEYGCAYGAEDSPDYNRTRGPEWYCGDAEEVECLTEGGDITWIERMAATRRKGSYTFETFKNEHVSLAFDRLKPDFWKTSSRRDLETLKTVYVLEFEYI